MATSKKAPFQAPTLDEIAAARRLGEEGLQNEPHAQAIGFDAKQGRFQLLLTNGTTVGFTAAALPELADVPDELLGEVQVLGMGKALAWPALDLQISVAGLVLDLFGGDEWRRALHAEMNRRLARSGSEARARASRENGKKGGRPRKTGAT